MADAKDKPSLVLGIMSGTSMDAVDYCLCEVGPARVRLLRHWQVKFPPPLRRRLHAAASNQAASYELGQLHHDLGRFYAKHSVPGPRAVKPRLVGLHGQTTFHNPDRARPATFQLGEPAYLAEALRAPVVSNFRAADIAAGGQGAPLATLFHQIVFGKPGRHICINNLGGISNVTSLDWRRGRTARVLAFDTGPGNMLLDLAARHFSGGQQTCDRSGNRAARGKVAPEILANWLKHPLFRERPPKSTGRELFGEPFFESAIRRMSNLSPDDALATLTELTARSLALNYRLHLPSLPGEVILCGGGTANRHLVGRIRANLQTLEPSMNIRKSEELGWPRQSVEPAAFALLAYHRWRRKAGNLPETTGARRAVLLGQIAEA